MRTNLAFYERYQVFLNYPFDMDFEPFAHALHFAVIAVGLIPVCARDLTAPDRPRLEMLVDAITKCRYSVHDFSRNKGEGEDNLARFNMPIEMGMALFYGLYTQRIQHRCAFFVTEPGQYQRFASDLAGLDPKVYENDDLSLVASVHEWLCDMEDPFILRQPTSLVRRKYQIFQRELKRLDGSGKTGQPSHNEAQELMYQLCSKWHWWEWREHRSGQMDFPPLPLSLKDGKNAAQE